MFQLSKTNNYTDWDENIEKYNRLNGHITRILEREGEVNIRMPNALSKPTLTYSSETMVLIKEEKEYKDQEWRFWD